MTSPSLTSPRADDLAAFTDWRSARQRSVASPTGNLALVETRWLPAGADPAEEFARATAVSAETVTVTSLTRRNLDTGEPEHGLRFWDAASPAIQAFDTISAFDYNPDWVIDAQFTPVSGDRTIPFEHIRDNGGSRELVVPGDITFTRDGVDYSLSAFDDDGTLLLVFGDETNRLDGDTATYSSGRFLFVSRPESPSTSTGRLCRRAVFPCSTTARYRRSRTAFRSPSRRASARCFSPAASISTPSDFPHSTTATRTTARSTHDPQHHTGAS
jgi:uncharacterized protein (DUF1684 family)